MVADHGTRGGRPSPWGRAGPCPYEVFVGRDREPANPPPGGRVRAGMDTTLLEAKFARIGARLRLADRPAHRFRTPGPVALDVRPARRGEYFEVARRPDADADVEVLDVRPADRHLLLLVRAGREKGKFLCGHDERHWFVAAV